MIRLYYRAWNGSVHLYMMVLCYLEPASVKEELQQGKNRDVQVQSVVLVTFLGIQELSANHTEAKKWVNCNSYYLHRKKTPMR